MKTILYFFWGVIVAGLFIAYFAEYTKDFLNNQKVLGVASFLVTLCALLSRDQLKNIRKKELENEYRLIRETRHLTPEDFQFREMEPGEELKNSERPYF